MTLRAFEEPSNFVNTFHDLPHYDYDLRRFNGIFEAPLDANGDLVGSIEDYPYGQTLVVALAFMLVIGTVIFIVHIVWACCCRCCCRSRDTDEFGNKLTEKSTTVAKIGTVFFALLAIAASIYGFTTTTNFTNATDGLKDADSQIRSLQSNALTTGGNVRAELSNGADQINDLIDQLPQLEDQLTTLLDAFTDADGFVAEFETNVQEVELTEDIPDLLDDASEIYRALTITIFVVSMVLALMAMVNVFLSSEMNCMKLTISWVGATLMFLIWIAFSVEFVLAILISDVCIDSDTVVLDVAGQLNNLPDIGNDTIVFYVGCEETPTLSNPLNDTLSDVTSQLNDALDAVDQVVAVLPPGTGDDEVASINASLVNTLSATGDLGDLISCDSINPIYQEIQAAACNDVILALGNACVALGLVVGAVFASRLFICKEKPDPAEDWRTNNLAGDDYTQMDPSSSSKAPASSGIDYTATERRIEMDPSRSNQY